MTTIASLLLAASAVLPNGAVMTPNSELGRTQPVATDVSKLISSESDPCVAVTNGELWVRGERVPTGSADPASVARVVDSSFRGGTQEVNRVTGSFDGVSDRVDAIEGKEAGWDAKQDAIDDLAAIRAGAAKGETALQEHQSLEPATNYTDAVAGELRADIGGISAYTGVLESQKRNKRDLSVGWTWATDDPGCPSALVSALNRPDAPVPNLVMNGAVGEWGLGEVTTNGAFGWINFVVTKSPDAADIRFGFTDERDGLTPKYFATAVRVTSLATLAGVEAGYRAKGAKIDWNDVTNDAPVAKRLTETPIPDGKTNVVSYLYPRGGVMEDGSGSVVIGKDASGSIDPNEIGRRAVRTILRSEAVAIGHGATVVANTNQPDFVTLQGVAVGWNARAEGNGAVAIGAGAQHWDETPAGGGGAYASGHEAVALGYGAKALAAGAVQIGGGTNAAAGSLQFRGTPVVAGGALAESDPTVAWWARATNAQPRAVDGAARPLPKYLHERSFDDSYPEAAEEYYRSRGDGKVDGGCSAARDGGYLSRNFDYPFDDRAEFVVKMSAGPNRFASVGVAQVGTNLTEAIVTSGKPSPCYKWLPGATVDGINENGVVAEVNVVDGDPQTSGWHTTGDLHPLGAIRWILDHATNAQHAATYIAANIRFPAGWTQNFHYMIADETSTYIVENGNCYQAGLYDLVKPVLTNFRVVGMQEGSGIERYNLLLGGANITNVWYTRAYARGTNPPWLSEFGNNYEYLNAALNRWNDGRTKEQHRGESYTQTTYPYETITWWQSVHTSIYDITNRVLRVAVQETDDWYTFQVPAAGGVKVETDPTVPSWAKQVNPPEGMPATGLVWNATAGAVKTANGAKTIGAADVGAYERTDYVDIDNGITIRDGYVRIYSSDEWDTTYGEYAKDHFTMFDGYNHLVFDLRGKCIYMSDGYGGGQSWYFPQDRSGVFAVESWQSLAAMADSATDATARASVGAKMMTLIDQPVEQKIDGAMTAEGLSRMLLGTTNATPECCACICSNIVNLVKSSPCFSNAVEKVVAPLLSRPPRWYDAVQGAWYEASVVNGVMTLTVSEDQNQ